MATDIAAAWASAFNALCPDPIVLNEVDVIDIATRSGLSGQWTGANTGTRGTTALPYQCCTDVEYGIARRYRGGKPRAYFPFGIDADLANFAAWSGAFLNTVNAAVTAFFTAVQALSVGAMGGLTHVSLSYYESFTNIINSSGRERAVPTYKAVATHDNVTGYFAKAVIGSQKRRRTSTTP